MKPSHEWPQPPSTLKSSSLRRQLTRESLASVDWYKACRYESYSDGDDDFHTREPLEAACQSSGYGERTEIIQSSGSGDYIGFQISAYDKGKGIQCSGYAGNHEGGKVQAMQSSGLESAGYGNCKDFQGSGYGDSKGFGIPSITTKIILSNKEGKANRRVDNSSIVPQQPLRLNACSFSGASKLAGKPHTTQLSILAHMASEENTCFDTREPFSPEVTCLGRVRVKEKQGHETEHWHTKQQNFRHVQRHALESKKDKNPKDVTPKGSRKKETAEKRSCLPRRKRREDMERRTLKLFGPSSSAVVPSETVETRRERAALLARSLTTLLEDLRRLEMEDSKYVPAMPPPNSLLLMRGFGITNKSWNQEVSTLLNENAFQSEENKGTITENSCEDSSANGIQIADVKMQKSMTKKLTTRVQNFNVAAQSKVSLAQKVFPLSEIESNSLVHNPSSSEMNNKRPMGACQQDLALWQRRAIGKLAAIDTKGPMRMEIKQPSTK